MRCTFLLALGFASCNALASDCSLPALKDKSNEHPECLFYIGTKNFREKNFAAAFGSWERLRTLKEVPSEFEGYKVDAYNNLGYLYFMGLGTKANTKLALDYWKLAYKAGHAESSYHLCHAYGDADHSEYRPKAALGYCEEAMRRYGKVSDVEPEILQQLRQYVSRLRPQ